MKTKTYNLFSHYATDDPNRLTIQLVEEYNSVINERQFDSLWFEAYCDGHSAGLEEVYYQFIKLVKLYLSVRVLET